MLIAIRARAYLYFFLLCDPGCFIKTSLNEKVYRCAPSFMCINKMCVDIRFITSEKMRFRPHLKFQKNVGQMRKLKFLRKSISGEVCNSTSLPSGNLVDGLPLDSHNTDARGF